MPATHHGTAGLLALNDVDPDAIRVVRKLRSSGHEAYLVGGCVRDLVLRRRPKDFDVATSATPEAIRRTFRNSRIIGRRFRLAHVFFGPKIIETSTFRAAPRANEGDEDLLITHDNEWGNIEEDALRRDFTINGLFFDVESQQIVDYVEGMTDLGRRVIRTIGEPQVRFREDPVRMLRAIKFAARLDFEVEDATWTALLATVPDVSKCSKARILEEIYKLMRGGASRRSFELLLQSGILGVLLPGYLALHGQGGLRSPSVEGDGASDLFWEYQGALDRYVQDTNDQVTNGVLVATLFAPLVHDAGETRQGLDRHIDQILAVAANDIGVARRDRELAKQILMASQRMMQSAGRRRRRPSIAQRQYFHEALVFLGISVDAHRRSGSELTYWKQLAESGGAVRLEGPHDGSSDDGPPEPGDDEPRGGRRRRRGGRRRRRGGGGATPPAMAASG